MKGMYELAHSLGEKDPKNIIDAQFSIPYVVSLSLTGNSPAKGLSEAHLKDDLVRSLARRVNVEIDPEADRLYFEKGGIMASTVIIETANNERFEDSVYYPKGSPQNPLSTQELEKKFLSLTSPVLGKGKAEKILESIKDLEKMKETSCLVGN